MKRMATVFLPFLLLGCASERVVLLPNADGHRSVVVVKSDGAETLLDQPYAAAQRAAGRVSPYAASAEDVGRRFGAALGAQPARPRQFIVYFIEGKDVLTDESQATLDEVRKAIQAYPAAEAVVVGHTDRVGSLQVNDALSVLRAETVRSALVAAGLPESAVSASGRGEREPLVPTEDEVAEPRNRRVVITVR